ncbi:MAG: hypothetical protein KDH88_06335 [Chromatiales bacterium]|nr:hypothetical protein [Chromatiales bacterium]
MTEHKAFVGVCALVVTLLCGLPLSAAVGAEPRNDDKKRVLILHSYGKGLSWTDKITDGFQAALDPAIAQGMRLEVNHEFMDTKRFSGDAYYQKLFELYSLKYKDNPYDVIISADDNALNFLLGNRDLIFGYTPVVFCGINRYTDDLLEGHKGYTGVVEAFDVQANIELIMKLHPKTRKILIVSDQTTSGRANKRAALEVIPEFQLDGIDFEILDTGTIEDYRAEVARQTPGTVIFSLLVNRDGTGRYFTYEEAFDIYSKDATVPIYSPWDFYLGRGAVGGLMISGFQQGFEAARMALRILRGGTPEEIPIRRNSPNRYQFDYLQMQRFGIAEELLPPGAQLINKRDLWAEFYDEYRLLIWLVAAFILTLLIIIVFLIINIVRRLSAERALAALNRALVQTNDAFSRFVPHKFLEFLGHKSIVDVELGDQVQQEFAILFSDIRSFTTLSESMTARETFAFINQYLSEMGPVVREHHGFIDKYIGDAIMALFPRSAADAVDAAVQMQQRVRAFNEQRRSAQLRFVDTTGDIAIGIGIHTGSLMLGTIGESERMEGTVISDAVNLAARLESLTKTFGVGVAISAPTLRACLDASPDNELHYRFLGSIQVKGKREAVKVFEVYDGDADEIRALKDHTLAGFNEAQEAMLKGEFDRAKAGFSAVLEHNPNDQTCRFLIAHCDQLIDQAQTDWDGVLTMKSK